MDLTAIEIKSNKFILRPISKKYANVIFKEFTDDITTYMLPRASDDINVTYEFIDESIKGMKSGNNLQLVIVDNLTQEFIGCIGLHNIKNIDPEIGIWIKKDAQGNGFGYESVFELISWAKINLKFEYLRYPVDKRNKASRRIPEKNNGIVKREYKSINQSGFELDQIEYWIYK